MYDLTNAGRAGSRSFASASRSGLRSWIIRRRARWRVCTSRRGPCRCRARIVLVNLVVRARRSSRRRARRLLATFSGDVSLVSTLTPRMLL